MFHFPQCGASVVVGACGATWRKPSNGFGVYAACKALNTSYSRFNTVTANVTIGLLGLVHEFLSILCGFKMITLLIHGWTGPLRLVDIVERGQKCRPSEHLSESQLWCKIHRTLANYKRVVYGSTISNMICHAKHTERFFVVFDVPQRAQKVGLLPTFTKTGGSRPHPCIIPRND